MTMDPVCGSEVDRRTAPAAVDYLQVRYHFCSEDCAREFEGNPDLYARKYHQARKQRILTTLFR